MEETFINAFLNYLENAWDLDEYKDVEKNSIKLLKGIPKKFNALLKKNDLDIHFVGVSEEDVCVNIVLDIMRSEEGFFTGDFIESETAELITELIYMNFKELGFSVENEVLIICEE